MAKTDDPVLSVIIRRFHPDQAANMQRASRRIQKSVARHPGFVGLQNSLSEGAESCELVTVIAFDAPHALESWKHSPQRQALIVELDGFSQDSTSHTQFGDLALLLHPKARIRKIETIAILIFWILLLGAALRMLAERLIPGLLPPVWQNALLVSVNVMLISYLFLPWSSFALARLKTLLSRNKRPK